jgi:energy-coupling factor transport system substrate-specific component
MRLAVLSALGVALFLWPFFGGTPPAYLPALVVAVAAVATLALLELGTRRLDSRGLALIAALAALDAGLRLAVVTGIGGFSPVFFLILCAGFVFGPSFGFLTGALALLVSALATGGIGPWLPYQLFAAGWVGAAAGLVAGRRLWVLAVIGAVTGLAFGALMDVWDWSTFYRGAGGFGWMPGLSPPDALQRFGRFYLATSLAYDSFRSLGNVVMVWLFGPPVVAALRRLRLRLTFERIELPIGSAALSDSRPSP